MTKRNIAKKEQARNRDLLEQWRALRRAGVYATKEKASIGGLTKSRRDAIKKKYNELQGLGTYQHGVIYRPLHKQVEERPVYKTDEMGRKRFLRTQKTERYVMDTDHFQVFKRKPKAVPGDSLKTSKGMIAPKSASERLRITKDGKVKVTENKGSKALTEFTREPLSGPVEFIAFMDDVLQGRLKFKKNEGVVLISNGFRQRKIGQSAVMELARTLQRYAAGQIFRHTRGRLEKGSFDDWSSNSEIALYRRR